MSSHGVARRSTGPTVKGSRLPEQPPGTLPRCRVTNLHPAPHHSWSTTEWMISSPSSKPCARKAATCSKRSTIPSTGSLAGSSIPKETRLNSGNRLSVNNPAHSADWPFPRSRRASTHRPHARRHRRSAQPRPAECGIVGQVEHHRREGLRHDSEDDGVIVRKVVAPEEGAIDTATVAARDVSLVVAGEAAELRDVRSTLAAILRRKDAGIRHTDLC